MVEGGCFKMFATGVIMLFCSSLFIGYKVGNKYEFGLWEKDSEPKKITASNIVKLFNKIDK